MLSIGVYLIFADALASLREDAGGFAYEFKPMPLRNAADRLLSGRHADAFDAFGEIHKSGRKSAGALGMAAACWAAGQKKYALDFAMFVRPGRAGRGAQHLQRLPAIARALPDRTLAIQIIS